MKVKDPTPLIDEEEPVVIKEVNNDHSSSKEASAALTVLLDQTGSESSQLQDEEDTNELRSRYIELEICKRNCQLNSIPSLGGKQQSDVASLEWSDLEVGRLLGTGGFSSVFGVVVKQHQEETQETNKKRLTVKYLHDKAWKKREDKVANAAADLVWEANILSRLQHPNIIHIYGMPSNPSFLKDQQEGFFLILDRLEETLYDRLERWRVFKHKGVLDRLDTTVLGIAQGMEYLHSHNIAFCDLTPRNIGFDELTGIIKIFDFGLAMHIPEGELRRTMVGTFRYTCPESILGRGYDLSCDVYSFGVILYQICSLELRFVHQLSRKAEFTEWIVKRDKRPSLQAISCPKRINRLIKECWHPDPLRRPCFKTIRRRLEKILTNKTRNH